MKRPLAVLGAAAALALAALGWWLRPPRLPAEPRFLSLELPELRIWARADQVTPAGQELDVAGDEAVIWLESPRRLGPVVFRLSGHPGRVEVRSSASRHSYRSGGEPRFFFEWQPETARRAQDRPGFFYRLTLAFPDRPAPPVASSGEVRIALVGTRAFLDRDLYHVDWLGCGAPESVAAGEELLVLAHARNTSAHPWPHEGAARVRMASRWLGTPSEAGARSDLRTTVPPQGEAEGWLRVPAPEEPGRHELEIDLYFEPVAWFSEKGVATCRVGIEVR